jgi:hypothetical protein
MRKEGKSGIFINLDERSGETSNPVRMKEIMKDFRPVSPGRGEDLVNFLTNQEVGPIRQINFQDSEQVPVKLNYRQKNSDSSKISNFNTEKRSYNFQQQPKSNLEDQSQEEFFTDNTLNGNKSEENVDMTVNGPIESDQKLNSKESQSQRDILNFEMQEEAYEVQVRSTICQKNIMEIDNSSNQIWIVSPNSGWQEEKEAPMPLMWNNQLISKCVGISYSQEQFPLFEAISQIICSFNFSNESEVCHYLSNNIYYF